MTTKISRFFLRLALIASLAAVLPQQASATALSIAQEPLFITISMPPNITLLLDDSGSLQWAHVPDWLAQKGNATLQVLGTVKVTGSHNPYSYSCNQTGYTLVGSSTGSTSTPPSTTYCYEWFTFSWGSINVSSDSSTGAVYVPDTNHYKCACFNPLAYDPSVTYSPGNSPSGTPLTTSFTSAYVNPYVTSLGTVDLSTSYEATVDYNPSTSATTLMTSSSSNHNAFSNVADEVNSCNGLFTTSSTPPTNTSSTSATCQTVHNPQNAFYYVYNASNTGCSAVNTDDRCMTKVVVSSTSSPSGGDERQNFANWFSFYRTRNLTVNTGANLAMSNLSGSFRVAWRDLNTMVSSSNPFQSGGIKDWAGNTFDNRIGVFTSTHRTNFFTWLQRYGANNGTALRTALDSIGAYYETPAGVTSPFAFTPAVDGGAGTDSPEYVCRPNYAIVMTDGLWNDSSIPSSPSISNNDNTTYTLPDGTSFTAGTHPYSDSTSQTLADIAFYYWSHTLRSDLGTSTSLQYMPYNKAISVTDSTNKTVSLQPYWNPQNDPATWPHMVTFTVGLGMTGTITNPAWGGSTYAGGYSGLVTGTTPWPTVSSNSSNNVYDLWHAAIDSRGQFFSADTPQDVVAAFGSIINRIQGRVGSSSAIAVNSTRLDSNTFIYQAQFNSASWTGEVLAFPINTDGSIGAQAWAASAKIPAAASRTMYTWNETSSKAVSFTWSKLSTAEQTNLNTSMEGSVDGEGQNRVDYLTGVQTLEQDNSGGIFRNRSSLLGDIVDSNPQYVGVENFGFDVLPGAEGSGYDGFVAGKSSNTPMLYVGANDGMMHALNANTGVEQFTYIPRGVYPNLSALTDPLYTHEFYVDGSAQSVDAYISGNWKTLLVGTTGPGAREIFLMDVSNPASFAASNILWDYDGATQGDNNMGYTFGQATIARLPDGNWYVVFGNGYNSPNQHAGIYLYNLNTKALTFYDTGVGSTANPDGMSAPNPVTLSTSVGNDRITDTIYAGDLQGNVWKLDVSSNTSSNWKYYSYGAGKPTPLFTGYDSSGNVQPITDRVQVGLNSLGQIMVYFGTGTYFLTTDNTVGSSPPVMSFYGIIDDLGNTAADVVKGTSSTDRSELLQQYIVATVTVAGTSYRIVTTYPMTGGKKGWFIDLNFGGAQGERVVSDAVIDNGRIIFTTLIPQGNACSYGGTSWLMEVDSTTGGDLTVSPFDTNGDGKVNSNDFVNVTYTDPTTGKSVNATVPVSGKQSNVGIIKTPGIISAGQLEYKYYSGSTGSIGMTTESGNPNTGRLSWQQLQ